MLTVLLLLIVCGKQTTQPESTITLNNQLLALNCEGFTLWLDCTRRSSVRFKYTLTRDRGNRKRHDRFYLDPDVPARCQQTSTDSYQRYAEERFDRGHLVQPTMPTTPPKRSGSQTS